MKKIDWQRMTPLASICLIVTVFGFVVGMMVGSARNGGNLWYAAGGAVAVLLLGGAACWAFALYRKEEVENKYQVLLSSFWQLAESNRIGLAAFEADGSLKEANPVFCELTGFSSEELKQQRIRWQELTASAATPQSPTVSFSSTGVLAPQEKEIRRKDGCSVRVLQGAARLDEASGQGVYFVQDLSDRLRIEEALKDSHALYQSLVEALPIQLYRKDRSGAFVYVNDRFCEMAGKTREELLGKTSYDFHPEALAEKYAADDRHVLETGEVFHDIEEHFDGQGNRLFVEVIKSPVRDHGGRIIGTQGIFWDVTQHHLAEQAHRLIENRFSAFMKHWPGAAFIKDASSRFLFVNETFTATFGCGIDDLNRLRDKAPFQAGDDVVLAENRAVRSIETIEHRDGTRHWLIHKFPIPEDDRNLIGGVAVDITELRKTQLELQAERDFMSAIQDSARILVVAADRQGRIKHFSKSCERVTGFTADEVRGKHLWEMIASDDEKKLVQAAFQKSLYEFPNGFVDHWRCKDGTARLIEWQNKRFADESDEYIVCTGIDITEQERARLTLKESEARSRLILEQIPLVVWTTDRELNFTSSMGAGLLHLGLQPGQMQMLGTSLYTYFHTNDPDHPNIAAHRRALDGICVSYDTEWLGRQFQVRVEPFKDELGNIIGAIGVALDITERKRAEQALMESHALLDGIFFTGPVGYAFVDRGLRYVRINECLANIIGMSADQIIGKTVHDVLPDEWADDVQDILRRVLETGQPVLNHEITGQMAADREDHTWLTNYYAVRTDGHILGVAVACMDITELKRAEKARRESEQLFRATFENAGAGMVHVEPETGRILAINAKGCDILGRPEEELRRLTVADVSHPDDWKKDEEALQKLAGGDISEYATQKRYRRPDGLIWCDVSVTCVRDASGKAERLIAVLNDVTDRVHYFQEVEKLNRELEWRVEQRTQELQEANKELEAFTYSVSHDLRAPLRAIDGFARILLDDFGAQMSPQVRHYITRIRDNGAQMSKLISDLLTFSRLGRQVIEKRPIHTTSLVREALDNLRSEREGRCLEITIAELPDCEADAALLRQVFINLISNALKYTRPRSCGRIEIGYQFAQDSAKPIYYVRDNGVGFDMSRAGRLFGVFQRLHSAEEFEGTGVGLATCQRIIQRHGGRIWAEAEPEKGATFYFTLAPNND
ncbi:MAG: hypothetical protein KatS3mg105_3891 [Gemmatales bacterium]|nr:MAG: hypothetical protein KatS3mg105_3891 [Gemmatales bacterium]